MKVHTHSCFISLAFLAFMKVTTDAWLPLCRANRPMTMDTQLSAMMSRRKALFGGSASFLIIAGGIGGVVMGAPSSAYADIDYSKVQDLLGAPDSNAQAVLQGKRPTYLTEPTVDFKTNEAKAADFKREQIRRKKDFLAVLELLETDPNDGPKLVNDLDQMRRMVRDQGGLPLGITKQEVVQRIRKRKAKRYWPTEVEIAYQDLVAQIQYQQSPNTERDMDNPF